jgi:hypothetical protein
MDSNEYNKKMYVDNILWIYSACFKFVLKCVALLYVFCCCFLVYVVPYSSEISGENNIWDEIKLDALHAQMLNAFHRQ